ncbi:MAG: hypothetical protein VYD64_09040 [Pseudomonadota bacterium]|nr:hypothetical protein [Pseudomonadota bacterium]
MTKGTTSRRGRTRPDIPRTIDLDASQVRETKADDARVDPVAGEPAGTLPPEPVAMPAAGGDRPDQNPGLSGFGATADRTDASRKKNEPGKPGAAARAMSAGAAFAASAFGRKGQAYGTPQQPAGAPQSAAGASRSGSSRSFLAGALGALAVLVVVGGLNAAGLLGAVPLLGGLASRPSPDAGLTDEIATLDKRIAALEASTRAAPQGPDTTELANRMETLASRLATAESRLDDTSAAAATGETGLAGLEARIGELSERVVALADAPADAPAGAVRPSEPAELAALRDRIESAAQSASAAGQSVSGITARVDALEAASAALEKELAALARTGQEQAAQDRAARIMAASALETAYLRGEPFGDLAASLQALTGPSPALAALEPFAATGVATDAELVAGFDAAADRILAVPAPEQDGIVARLFANARSLVEVRPAGPVEGDTLQAVLSRVEAHLGAGEHARALAEWRTMPQDARDAAGSWGERLERRVAGDHALRGVLAGLGTTMPATGQ